MTKKNRLVLGIALAFVAASAAVLLFGLKQVEWCDDAADTVTSECHSAWQWRLW